MMKSKKPLLKTIMAIVAIASAILFVPWDILWTWGVPSKDTIQEQVSQATNHGLEGIIVYVDQAGSAPAHYSAGWDDREKQVPVDPHSLFKIASISKLYIAAATAKLVNDDSLSLDETLAYHLPNLFGQIENADQITVKMLLQHRSGIPDFINKPTFPWDDLPRQLDPILALILGEKADFVPNEDKQYSNTNYLLIGRILDKVLGRSCVI